MLDAGADGQTDAELRTALHFTLEAIADHAFALAIYDQVTGSVLFIGRVSDPSQTM